jgi:uncharacterized membrane protein YeaQ/YmgE (transglycosylase-associated protein family)
MSTNCIGALCFGIVIGWITYRTLRRTQTNGLSDLATIIGAVGGAAITGLFPRASGEFGFYSIGLLLGFFAYLLVALAMAGKSAREGVGDWLGSEPGATAASGRWLAPPPARGDDGANLPPPPAFPPPSGG